MSIRTRTSILLTAAAAIAAASCGNDGGTGGTGGTATSTTSTADGTTTTTGASMCGTEAACATPSTCPATSDCTAATCTAGCCGVANAPAGTACTSDGGKVCDGGGTCVGCNDANDCPVSSTVCMIEACDPAAHTCGGTPAPIGTPCADNGGVVCNGIGTCVQAHCMDGVKDADETDQDCGGASCSPCADTLKCLVGSDCASHVCDPSALTCTPPSCTDMVKNGNETDKDCGGPDCDVVGATCPVGDSCANAADCETGYCMGGACATKPDGATCGAGTECTNGNCVEGLCCDTACNGTCQSCTAAMTGGVDGTCGNILAGQPAPPGQCTPAPPCGNDGKCGPGGVCELLQPITYFTEDFHDNSKGWTLGATWQIGPAVAGCPGCVANPDPGVDHTPTSDNGIAGVVLGGPAPTTLHGYYYLTSPPIDTSQAPTLALSFWRWLNSDYDPYMHNVVEVSSDNGATWTTLPHGLTGACCGVMDAAWTNQPLPANAPAVPTNSANYPTQFDLTAFKSPQMRIRFGHNVGLSGVYPVGSWNLDDISLTNAICP